MTFSPPPACSCIALRQAARHVTRFYDSALTPVGIGLNQYAILATLERLGPIAIQPLAARLVMDRSTLGHLLRPLETRGLVAFAVPPDDKRSRLIALSAAGQRVLAEARPLWFKAEQRFQEVFGAAETQNLRSLLKQAASAEFGPV
jgi:DNA-binding MarR family transcriptional regulator